MQYFNKTVFVFLLFVVQMTASAQDAYFPNIQKAIPEYLSGFNNVILYYRLPTNGMGKEFNIGGYGMIEDSLFEIRMVFTEGGGFANDRPNLKTIVTAKITDTFTIKTIKAVNVSSVFSFNKDSLNVHSDDINVSDANTDVLFAMLNRQSINVLAYQPEFFQYYSPTEDRKRFISIKEDVLRSFEIPFDSDLVMKCSDLDSVIFIRKTNYTEGELGFEMYGFGIKGDSTFCLSILMGNPFINYGNVLKYVRRRIVKSKVIESTIHAIKFSSVATFIKDSLEYDPAEVHDAYNMPKSLNTYFVYVVLNSKLYYREVFEPIYYQKQYPTDDRAEFLSIWNKVQNAVLFLEGK